MKDVTEWSNMFDVSYNNITSNQAPGLNEYEKSVYLTRAENELVKNWFDASSKGNNIGKGFDESAIRQEDFLTLQTVSTVGETGNSFPMIDPRALVFSYPTDAIAVINEQIGLGDKDLSDLKDVKDIRQVIPLSYVEYTRLMSKPFKEPLKRQAWRLLNMASNQTAEIIISSVDKSKYEGRLYIARYIRKPKPIILEDLANYGDNIKIDGETSISTCELGESTHEAILQRAVELAKIAWNGDANETQLQMTSGQRSE